MCNGIIFFRGDLIEGKRSVGKQRGVLWSEEEVCGGGKEHLGAPFGACGDFLFRVICDKKIKKGLFMFEDTVRAGVRPLPGPDRDNGLPRTRH